MNGSWQGFAAIVIFFLLIVLFLAAVAATPAAGVLSGTTANGAVAAPAVVQPVATPPNTPSVAATNGQSGGTTYTVQPGDWLSSIARQYNTTAPAILAANPQITDSDTIRPGQVIVIP